MAHRMNKYLYRDSMLNGPVQTWFGMLDAQKAKVISLNLDHNEVFHFMSAKNLLQKVPDAAHSLSLQNELPELVSRIVELADGDVIVVVSDGVTAALNQQREKFGVEPIERQVQKNKHAGAGESLQAIRQDLLTFNRDAYIRTECSIIVIKRCSDGDEMQN